MSTVLKTIKSGIHHYRKLSVRNRALLWVVVLVIGVIILPPVIDKEIHRNQSVKMYFTVPNTTVSVGETFPLELRVQTGGQAINAVGSIIHFNPLYLEVVSMTTDKSFCSFYLDNTFDTIKGEVKVTCGTPSPGFTGDSLVVHLNMRAKILGTTTVSVDPANTNALANDGKGTNILGTHPDLELTINQFL